jgi:hypothetical protein
LLLELLTEDGEEGVDEGTVFNMIPELPKLVANGLDPLAKNSDR